MPADPFDRLAAAAPDVDTDRALGDLRGLVRRRAVRARAVLGAAVVVALFGSVVALTRDDPDAVRTDLADERTTTTGATTSALEATTTAPTATSEPPSSVPATVPATDATVPPTEGTPPATAGTPEVHVDVAQPVGPYTAGGRGAATVVVSNQGDAPAPWNGGGCRPMAMVRLVTVPREGQPFDDEYWDGARPLHEWLATSTPTFGSDFEGAGTIDYVQWYCAANLTFEFLDAGASEQLDLLVDLRFPHGPLPTFQIEARFPGMQDGTGAVTTTVPVSVVDDPAREPSYDAAVAAMEADPRLEDFMDRTRPAGAMSPCCWYPDLGWWDGAWDLRLFPVWGDGHVLRMRYSPADGSLSVDEPMSADQLPPGS